jgi:hypothetical protein
VGPELAQAPTSTDKAGQLVLDQSICRQPISQALVFALIGSLASCPRHEDVFDGFEFFEELLDRIHGSPLLAGERGTDCWFICFRPAMLLLRNKYIQETQLV